MALIFVCYKETGWSLGCYGRWYFRHRLRAHEYKAGRGNTRFNIALCLHVWMNRCRFSNMKLAWAHRETPFLFFINPNGSLWGSFMWTTPLPATCHHPHKHHHHHPGFILPSPTPSFSFSSFQIWGILKKYGDDNDLDKPQKILKHKNN